MVMAEMTVCVVVGIKVRVTRSPQSIAWLRVEVNKHEIGLQYSGEVRGQVGRVERHSGALR